jgi:hypothetical protein
VISSPASNVFPLPISSGCSKRAQGNDAGASYRYREPTIGLHVASPFPMAPAHACLSPPALFALGSGLLSTGWSRRPRVVGEGAGAARREVARVQGGPPGVSGESVRGHLLRIRSTHSTRCTSSGSGCSRCRSRGGESRRPGAPGRLLAARKPSPSSTPAPGRHRPAST